MLSDLRKRHGWTPASIRDFADPPDQTKPNRRGGSGVKLYRVSRIHEIEDIPEIKEQLNQAAKRSQNMRNVASKKKECLIEEVCTCKINVHRMDIDKVRKNSIRHYTRGHSTCNSDLLDMKTWSHQRRQPRGLIAEISKEAE